MTIKRFRTREEVIAHIQGGGKLTHKACEIFREDLDCIKEAVRHGQRMSFSEHIMDGELLILLLENDVDVSTGSAKCRKLLRDRKTALKAVGHLSKLDSLPHELLDDDEFAIEVMKYRPRLLKLFSTRIRNDPSLMSSYLNDDFTVLGDQLRDDCEFILALGSGHRDRSKVLEAASERLLGDREFILRFCGEIPFVAGHKTNLFIQMIGADKLVCHLSHALRDDEEVARAALACCGFNYQYLSTRLKEQLPLLSLALSNVNGYFLAAEMEDWGMPIGLSECPMQEDEETGEYLVRLIAYVEALIVKQRVEKIESLLPMRTDTQAKKMKL